MTFKLIGCVLLTAMLVGCVGMNKTPDASSVNGSADGPTSVIITGKQDEHNDGLVMETEMDANEDVAYLPLGVYMKAISYEKGQLTVVIDNQSGADYRYGKEYSLQKLSGEDWVEVKPVAEYGWPKISLMIKDLEKAYEVYDLTVFGDLEAGNYKLVKNDLEATFVLTEGK